MRRILLSLFCLTTTLGAASFAIEAIEPKQTCERFLNPGQKKECLQLIQKASPDSYLAALCEKQFDDAAFLKCLQLSVSYEFDPRKIQDCAADEMPDETRFTCLSQAGRSRTIEVRAPASQGKNHRIRKNHRTSR